MPPRSNVASFHGGCSLDEVPGASGPSGHAGPNPRAGHWHVVNGIGHLFLNPASKHPGAAGRRGGPSVQWGLKEPRVIG